MSLGSYLKSVRADRQLTLREVEALARSSKAKVALSSGYVSMLENDDVKQPSPQVLFALAAIYEIDYLDLMKKAAYLPSDVGGKSNQSASVTFRGASQLTDEQRGRVQRIIDFELADRRRQRKGKRQK